MNMHSYRNPVSTKKMTVQQIKSMVYRTGKAVPVIEHVHTLVPLGESETNQRFPVLEGILGVQDVIQECIVTHYNANGQMVSEIFLALQYRPEDPINIALQQLYAGSIWRGDIVAMKKGKRVLVTALKNGADVAAAKHAVDMFLRDTHPILLAVVGAQHIMPTFPSVLVV
ncbi:hypothetical protein EUX98_g7844 [Antrodiella citrinella]|uniref:Uncharacterized protein n=1 Tax=Antrodiella citrinella TaxID=2447956 RepID=A0A4S4MKJ3_9APHY|nr:hypothetical protein EUX98_g7844 [Antrodiella citrinella]